LAFIALPGSSLKDALLLAVAAVTAGILVVNALLPKRHIPLTVNVISAAFILLGHGSVRMLPRLWGSNGTATASDKPRQRVLIVGAGDTGQTLAWELGHNRTQPYQAVGFVDDEVGLRQANPRHHGRRRARRYPAGDREISSQPRGYRPARADGPQKGASPYLIST
jgi:FlaA1/EpsC-like NDP-sugar epimerase